VHELKDVFSIADGVYYGKALSGTTGGEICFTTGTTGYREEYDPSYCGQVLIANTCW